MKYTDSSGRSIPVQIWDTAGQERFNTITYSFYWQAQGVIIVFDVTNRETFDSVKKWINSIAEHADPSIIKVLVGNKIDLEDERQVQRHEAGALAAEYKIWYFETSAKENQNVWEVINHMMEEVYEKKIVDIDEYHVEESDYIFKECISDELINKIKQRFKEKKPKLFFNK